MSKYKHKEKDESSKLKIMDAAEQMFAEKGYSGARTSEIAALAGVNSALIYYYYDSKEEILHELMSSAIDQAAHILDKNFEKIHKPDEMMMKDFINDIVSFLENKKRILRIMLIELFKGEKENYSFFEMLDPLYEKITDKVEELGGNISDKALFRSQLFFIFSTPIIMHVTVGDKWSKFNKVRTTETKKMLFQLIKEMISKMILKETK